MNTPSATRIQTSILNKSEKKLLIWIAKRLPQWITSDALTFIGIVGALISGIGYILSNYSENYLWLASFGLIINWFGDSLDGTLARVRNKQRPIYGFFIDHNIDGLTVIIICIGAGLSPYLSLSTALFVLVGYLLLSIFTYINTYLKGEFRLTYGKLGPTEFRLIIILINIIFHYFSIENTTIYIAGLSIKLFDCIGLSIAAALFLIYLISFCLDRKKYSKLDPPGHSHATFNQ